MKMRLTLGMMRLTESSDTRVIPWYYGVAYFEVDYQEYVLYPVPFNFVARWARTVRYTWNHFRGTAPQWIRCEAIEKEAKAGREAASYELGKQDGYRQGYEGAFDALNALLDSHERADRSVTATVGLDRETRCFHILDIDVLDD